jgi:hypothetical protein
MKSLDPLPPGLKDNAIRTRLVKNALNDDNYWAFKGRAVREKAHALIQYPAMMVPEMQGELIDAVIGESKTITRVFDPFVGSGTSLTEAMFRGMEFTGVDINPLALLSCKVKAGPFYITALQAKSESLIESIKTDKSTKIAVAFPNRDKWFRKPVQIQLSRIRRSIQLEAMPWARRFFWLAFAEAVRQCSNSRTSTFKLHIKSQTDIDNSDRSAIIIFSDILESNLKEYAAQATMLKERSLLVNGSYARKTDVILKNVIDLSTPDTELICSLPHPLTEIM